jgi:hypothetical protein
MIHSLRLDIMNAEFYEFGIGTFSAGALLFWIKESCWQRGGSKTSHDIFKQWKTTSEGQLKIIQKMSDFLERNGESGCLSVCFVYSMYIFLSLSLSGHFVDEVVQWIMGPKFKLVMKEKLQVRHCNFLPPKDLTKLMELRSIFFHRTP